MAGRPLLLTLLLLPHATSWAIPGGFPGVRCRATTRARRTLAQEEWDSVLEYEAALERYKELGLLNEQGQPAQRWGVPIDQTTAVEDDEDDDVTTEDMVVRLVSPHPLPRP